MAGALACTEARAARADAPLLTQATPACVHARRTRRAWYAALVAARNLSSLRASLATALRPRVHAQDQNNIEQSLACLPVFLAGCQKLLIVAGPTYTSRLWCVMEIFTFLHIIYPTLVSPITSSSPRPRRDLEDATDVREPLFARASPAERAALASSPKVNSIMSSVARAKSLSMCRGVGMSVANTCSRRRPAARQAQSCQLRRTPTQKSCSRRRRRRMTTLS